MPWSAATLRHCGRRAPKEQDMSQLKISGHRVWCPVCKRYAQLFKIPDAAKLINVNRRTIYRYIEQGAVFAVKTAGNRYRICASCLLKQHDDE
jgi:excisionase family DNA binding protein